MRTYYYLILILIIASIGASIFEDSHSSDIIGSWDSHETKFYFLTENRGKVHDKTLNLDRVFDYQLTSEGKLDIELYGCGLYSGKCQYEIKFLNDDNIRLTRVGSQPWSATYIRVSKQSEYETPRSELKLSLPVDCL